LCLLAAVLIAGAGDGIAQLPADAERGRALYENHCQVCHTPKVHSRADRLPINQAELRAIVDRWQQAENLRWSGQDVADVVDYLNRTRYGYDGTGR
jgi:mono/diheme cytochrome c family protein